MNDDNPQPSGQTFEFNDQQNQVIKSLASAMRWIGAVLMVVGALMAIAGILSIGGKGAASLLQGVLWLIIAFWTYKAAGAFRKIVDSQGNDVHHLMQALRSLLNLYRIQVILLAVFALILIVSLAFLLFSKLT